MIFYYRGFCFERSVTFILFQWHKHEQAVKQSKQIQLIKEKMMIQKKAQCIFHVTRLIAQLHSFVFFIVQAIYDMKWVKKSLKYTILDCLGLWMSNF